jgi:hypothetical protein
VGNDVAPEVRGDRVAVDEEGYFLTVCLWSSGIDVSHIGLEDVNSFECEGKFCRYFRLERLSHCVKGKGNRGESLGDETLELRRLAKCGEKSSI